VGCFLLFCVQDIFAQDTLLPNKVEARNLEGGATRIYSIALKDGDYAGFSISQRGTVNLTILRPDGSLMRRFPEPSGDVGNNYAFSAEGAGTYSINITNPTEQSSHYELKLEKALSLDDRLRPSVDWIDPNPSPQFAAGPKLPVRFYIEAGAFEFDALGQGGDILEASRELRDVLQAKGNEVHYHQFVGGHDALTWPGTIADSIIELLGS
jgi:hypothetical protein